MVLCDSNNKRIDIEDTPFAKGGEGAIYRLKNATYKDCCVKIFHPGKINSRVSKLDYMVKHQLVAPPNTQYRICWPIDFVFSGKERIGFIMPLSFNESKSLYDIYLDDTISVFDRRSELGVVNRLKLLYNIANAINIIHNEGYVLVDFKPQNILFTETGQISMIDLDSIQITKDDNLLFPATAFTVEYAFPAELSSIGTKKNISAQWDCYSFAIVAYQILLGIHPFTASTNIKDKNGNEISGIFELMSNNLFPFGPKKNDIAVTPPPQYYFFCLPPKIQENFIEAFNLQSKMPSMSDWLNILLESIQSKNIIANKFREKPKPPIYIIQKKDVLKKKEGDYFSLSGMSFYCDSVKINGIDASDNSEMLIAVPLNREIIITTHNKTYGKLIQKLVIPAESIYCINCGNVFESFEDIYCVHCGSKKV